MFKRTLKVFLLVGAISAAFFVFFNYYLPSRIGAAGQAHFQGAKHEPDEASGGPKEAAKEDTKSIADSLGVPRPVTVTYQEFDSRRIKNQKKAVREIFEIPEAIKPEVDFWSSIYTKYDKTKVVLHDREHLDIVYSVMDVGDIVNNAKLTDQQITDLKRERVGNEIKRLSALLEGIEGKKIEELNPEENRIYDLFKNINEKGRFKKAAEGDRLRSQTGIMEKFTEGIRVSGRYLGEIEKIFSEYNIPLEITRLAFVESMFNMNALSKAGASGIWQFMPGSGRLFLTIDDTVDERNDPILATHAAAKHLLRDYQILGTWPLAINAYNAGRGRLETAVSQMGTTDIAKIIKGFDHSGYGFASRNFYPAFLAALSAFENREKLFGRTPMEAPLAFDKIITPYTITLPELASLTGTSLEDIALLNFHLKEGVINGKRPIPKGFELKVPKGRGESFLVAMDEMNKSDKYAKWHIVGPEENLQSIAARYNADANSIKQANQMRNNKVKPGQIIRLPGSITLAKE